MGSPGLHAPHCWGPQNPQKSSLIRSGQRLPPTSCHGTPLSSLPLSSPLHILPRAVHAARCWRVSGIQFITVKNSPAPEQNSCSLPSTFLVEGRWWLSAPAPAAHNSGPTGFQCSPALAVAPLPLTCQSDLTAQQLPGSSSAPTLCQQLLGSLLPCFHSLHCYPVWGCWWETQDLGHLCAPPVCTELCLGARGGRK